MKKLLLPALLLCLCLPASASERVVRQGDDGSNLHLVLTLSDSNPSGERSERQIQVRSLDGGRSRVSTGWRIPIPMASSAAQAADRPHMVVSYQDIGVEVKMQARTVDRGRVRASGEFEVSAVDTDSDEPTAASAAPRVGTFVYVFDVVLDPEVETLLTEVPNPKGGSTKLAILASIDD